MALPLQTGLAILGQAERVDASARHRTARVLRWIADFESARVLHVFERSVNLVSGRGDVLSIVDTSIGPGPFNLVLAESVDFQRQIPADVVVSVGQEALNVGGLRIRLAGAETWNPVPGWRSLETGRDQGWLEVLEDERRAGQVQPAIRFDPPPDPQDRPALAAYAERYAGLGPGLTPSGDDVLMGLMHAYFVRFPEKEARGIGSVIAEVAAPRTTSLSGSWLCAAAEGEAGGLWHRLVDAAAGADYDALRATVRAILSVGHTSGADALAGFAAGILKT